ncbi:MAG TPA: PEP-CTERM sorting domain-containing protein [Candidatus Binatia bacterium]|nr:PEP-CTERM sorting domain-containing protein [Candidatus Binatia bacterium]
MRKQLRVAVGCLWMFAGAFCGRSAVTPLDSATQLRNPLTVNFDGYSDLSIANRLFQNQGMVFARDDGAQIFLLDWTALNRTTSSPDNVLATLLGFKAPIWASHLNLLPTQPLIGVGAYFGNDQADPDFTTMRMSAYGTDGTPLGSVQVRANDNTSVDQFIGLTSDAPIGWVRFDNLNSAGDQSANYAVVIDDLMFVPLAAVPEPSTFALIAIGVLVIALARGRWRRWRAMFGGKSN